LDGELHATILGGVPALYLAYKLFGKGTAGKEKVRED